jgi:hypothetical protein
MVYVALFGAIAMQNASLGSYIWFIRIGNRAHDSVFTSIPIDYSLNSKSDSLCCSNIGVLFYIKRFRFRIPYVSPSNMSLFVQENPQCH